MLRSFLAVKSAMPTAIGLMVVISLIWATAGPVSTESTPCGSRILAESYNASLHVNVSNDVERPVSAAEVHIVGNVSTWLTDEEGIVLISGILADSEGTEYTVYAECDGYLSSSPVVLTLTPHNTTFANLTVRGGGIYGTVSADGAALSGANVSIEELDLNTSTGVDGTYALEGIRSGTYSVRADAPYYEPVLRQVTVTVGDYVPLHFSLESLMGAISGTILHIDTEEPLENANIAVVIEDYTIVYNSDANGSYSVPNVPPGTYAITVSLTGFNTTVIENIVVASGVTTEGVDVLLAEKLPSISGTILHIDTEEPLEGANVSIAVGDYTITVKSDVNGSYRLWDIPPGIYSITASLIGFNTTMVEDVAVFSGVTTENVNILLRERPTTLSGVVKAGAVLLVGANVSIVGTGLYGISSIDGEYLISSIPAGAYTVMASLQGYNNATIVNVRIDRGTEVRLNINLTGKLGGALYGIVIDASTGNSLSGVRVTLVPQRETITNINGEFQFTGLQPGDYTIMFTLDGYRPMEMGDISISPENLTELGFVSLDPIRESFGGFIFGFDLAHSMMILALFLTIVILALAVVLRIRSFEAPDRAPAVYDELELEEEEAAEAAAEDDEAIYEG
ncbi:MAG: carboxypeptidase regulatory-like domain-containing protein [Methanobacteriota archaeon]|nr:MAG: carboxypeptidase regulatory-like domain-containing protein [Euryarchaeota archaeon]